jgi:integrase
VSNKRFQKVEGRRGVYRDSTGRLFIRAAVKGPDGVQRAIGPVLASVQHGSSAPMHAEKEAHDARAAIREGRHVVRTNKVWTVAAWVEELNVRGAEKRSDNTNTNRSTHQLHWLPILGDLNVAAVKPADLESVWRTLESKFAPSTLSVARVYLREPFTTAHKEGLMDVNIVATAKLPLPRQTRSRHVEESFDAARVGAGLEYLLRRDATSVPYLGTAAFVALQWTAGMRPGEVVQLRQADLCLTPGEGTLWVAASVDKARRARLVPLSDWQVALIQNHLDRGPRRPRKPRSDRAANSRRLGDVFPASFDLYAGRHKSALEARGEACSSEHNNTIKNLRHGARRVLESAPQRFRPNAINTLFGHSDQDKRVERAYSSGIVSELREMTQYLSAQIAPHWDSARANIYTPEAAHG